MFINIFTRIAIGPYPKSGGSCLFPHNLLLVTNFHIIFPLALKVSKCLSSFQVCRLTISVTLSTRKSAADFTLFDLITRTLKSKIYDAPQYGTTSRYFLFVRSKYTVSTCTLNLRFSLQIRQMYVYKVKLSNHCNGPWRPIGL